MTYILRIQGLCSQKFRIILTVAILLRVYPVPDPAHTILFNPPNKPFEIINIIISFLWMKAEATKMCSYLGYIPSKWLDRDILPLTLII